MCGKHTIVVLAILLVIVGDIEFLLAMFTHCVALSLYASVRDGCMFMFVGEIDYSGWGSQKLLFNESTRFLRRVAHFFQQSLQSRKCRVVDCVI
jgi:hypothetical protein